MKLTLHRVTFSLETPTYGVLASQEGVLCLTAERPWLDNKEGVSCVLPGLYECCPHDTPAKPHCWELLGVHNRSAILIHIGNNPMVDSKGCVLVGNQFYGGGVKNSVETMKFLRTTLPDNFTLEIINP